MICIVARDAGVEITPATAYSTAGVDVSALAALAAAPHITFHPLFGTALRLAAMVPGVDHAASPDTNHGTAVLGEISGDVNAYGITGIAMAEEVEAGCMPPPGPAR